MLEPRTKKRNLRPNHFARRTPTNFVAPVITGTVAVGQTLTVSQGLWNNRPDTFTYQWLRDGSAISGATGSSYVLVTADGGKAISVAVTGINNVGQFIATTAVTVSVFVPAPTNTVAPVISGTATQGSTLTSTNGTWTGSPTYTYQWKRGAANISGATSSSYVLAAGDVGNTITLVVTGTNAGGTANATSNGIGPVT